MTVPAVIRGMPPLENRGPELFEWFRRARREAPVSFDEESGTWNVYSHAGVERVWSDAALFSSEMGKAMPEHALPPALAKGNFHLMDPPRHRQLRALLNDVFTARMVAQMAPRVAQITNQLLDAVPDPTNMDLVEVLAYPLPVAIIGELLGIPIEDQERCKRWAEAGISITSESLVHDAALESVAVELNEMTEYLLRHTRERRARPREDLISRLLAAEVDGVRLDDEEVVSIAALLLVAGHITTVLLLGSAVLCLDEHPAAMAALRADPAALPGAVEEILRVQPPFTTNSRLTNREVTLGGQTIPEGQIVNLWIISANRDESRFADPERFDIRREPNPHLSFGRGIHFCLGAPLARLEGTIALEILLRRYRDIRRVPGTELEYYAAKEVHGVKHLWVSAN